MIRVEAALIELDGVSMIERAVWCGTGIFIRCHPITFLTDVQARVDINATLI